MLQYKYCIVDWKASWLRGKLYRNTVHCIELYCGKKGLEGLIFVLQYTVVYCNRQCWLGRRWAQQGALGARGARGRAQ